MTLPFSHELIELLADNRYDALTPFFQLFTWIGEIEGYVLLIALIYVTYDKRLAFQLSVVTLISMSLNHFVKMLIGNPRPFIADGSYNERWAVSAERAADLATEYSTPSGHGMAGGAFYAFLFASVRHPYVRIASVVMLLLTGLSRPYLGVHYLEDVLLGWVLGVSLALVALRHEGDIARIWNRWSHRQQIAVSVASTAALWIVTRTLSGGTAGGEPTAFLSYAGLLTGIVVAYPLELARVGFDPKSSTVPVKALRLALAVAMVLGTLTALDRAFEAISSDSTPWGDLLRYVRYSVAGIVAMFVVPLVFVKSGLGAGNSRGSPSSAAV